MDRREPWHGRAPIGRVAPGVHGVLHGRARAERVASRPVQGRTLSREVPRALPQRAWRQGAGVRSRAVRGTLLSAVRTDSLSTSAGGLAGVLAGPRRCRVHAGVGVDQFLASLPAAGGAAPGDLVPAGVGGATPVRPGVRAHVLVDRPGHLVPATRLGPRLRRGPVPVLGQAHAPHSAGSNAPRGPAVARGGRFRCGAPVCWRWHRS